MSWHNVPFEYDDVEEGDVFTVDEGRFEDCRIEVIGTLIDGLSMFRARIETPEGDTSESNFICDPDNPCADYYWIEDEEAEEEAEELPDGPTIGELLRGDPA